MIGVAGIDSEAGDSEFELSEQLPKSIIEQKESKSCLILNIVMTFLLHQYFGPGDYYLFKSFFFLFDRNF